MKKSWILFLSVWILAIGGCISIQATLFETQEDVQIQETILYGDKSVVEGVTVTQKARYRDFLHWDTTYQIGEVPKINTESQFSEMQLEDIPLNRFGINVQMVEETYPYEPEEKDNMGMSNAFLELAEETPNGESRQKDVYLKDYMEYYPFDIQIELPNDIYIDTRILSKIDKTLGMTEIDLIANRFLEFIKIPVLEEEMRHISVKKQKDGTVGSSTNSWAEGQDSFSFHTFQTYTDNMYYFTFDTHTRNGNLIDTSHMQAGYGIYAFFYDRDEKGIHINQLRNVYPLEPTEHILDLETDVQQEQLLLFTKEDNNYMLTVIDLETMQTKQKLVIKSYEEINEKEFIANFTPQIWVDEDFLVMRCQEFMLTVLSREKESGSYKVEYTTRWNGESPIATVQEFGWSDCHFDFNGTELVMCSSLYNRQNGFEECGFLVSVLDETGFQFMGRYDSSLNTGSYNDEIYDVLLQRYDMDLSGYFYMYECQLRRNDCLRVSW